ncbi:hypothetical protein [Streptomyces sp. NPDC093970]|uniref:hypothetical protein n=1 Tax=Streptomyces sp. NPDC093970 TaxID=3155076 RepID=UPI00343EB31C
MSGEDAGHDKAHGRRVGHPVVLAVAIGGYVLAAIAGLFVLAGDVGPVLLIPLWIVHAVLLVLLIRRLGARTSSTYTMLFIVVTSVMSVYVADMARDDLTLQRRGERVTATVVKEWRDAAEGRKARDYNYTLEREDGTKVPGPAMRTLTDLYDVGQKVTVIEDPQGELRPRTPGQADATSEELGSLGFALAALGAVAWTTWLGSDPARRGGDAGDGHSIGNRAYRKFTGARDSGATQEQQEEQLREALRTYPADRRGYIKIAPEQYPDVSQQRAARIAWELGLRAEASGNRGSWRFAEKVVKEVQPD